MQEKLEDIKNIQNTLWKIYKEFLVDHKVKDYTDKAATLVHQYSGKKDMRTFAENLIISWSPVINGLAADFKNGTGD